MSDLDRVLVVGTGPVSIQTALLLKTYAKSRVAIAGRESVRSASLFSSLSKSDQWIDVAVQNEKHRKLAGRCRVDEVFHGLAAVTGRWDTVILTVTTDAYIEALKQIDDQILSNVKCIALISPTLGSNSLVRHYIKDIQPEAEVISFSTYLGDTRWTSNLPTNEVKTTGVKNKIYAGSSRTASANLGKFRELYRYIGIVLDVLDSPIEAESRNISLYVHPPLFMNDFSLRVVFKEEEVKKYVYKLYPEGPITSQLIRDMRCYWKEISIMLEKMELSPVNLLKFMTDDNYPVRLESLSRHEIDQFTSLPPIHQEYLLFVRYASLLIDPFSEPDHEGRYFDFSAVPIKQIFVNKEGNWDIPRMPKEDYYRVKMIQGMARITGSNTPTLDKFIATYESKVRDTVQRLKDERLSDAFIIQSFEEDWRRIGEQFARHSLTSRSGGIGNG
ncbi:opine metallophore biosynthesis dehydrogenase [Paenibacillus sp. ATY16]|uniref:opine metallophore biosynthesis dehydrogenase n=1 Tax=Paenibacillus sp. ATY16 TaxID=1759312 RepID=UPI00200C91DF|nr:opine metallophore biosynthesis dehydrogenase [Paenibacillus sp. ATY16]MCK9859667.1 opine metallophore biosynthesis dehydrogenase [Paenibacillus sp. ATY16]